MFKIPDDEYVETRYIHGVKVDIGIDDAGQCYYAVWEDEDGPQEVGLGAFNASYLEALYHLFDPKGTAISLYGKEEYDNTSIDMIRRYVKNRELDPERWDEWFEQILIPRYTMDYELYDFDSMYKELKKND